MEPKSIGELREVRRIHIIYFLSHMGRLEHPHLIRVQHLNRNGVYLRDVKRWLADLRGKEVPEGYAWSYKRRYKTGYVWQDLLDDDLITPISDNEYVLKGSEITATYFEDKGTKYKPGIKVDADKGLVGNIEERVQLQKNYFLKEASQKTLDSKIGTLIQSNISSELTEESTEFNSDRSTLTDEFDSMNLIEQHEEKNLCQNYFKQKTEQEQQQQNKFHNIISSFFPNLPHELSMKNDDIVKETVITRVSTSSLASSSSSKSKSPYRKSKNYSSGASNMFRNLISCKGVDTNDAMLVMSNRIQYKDKTAANKLQVCNGRSRDYKDGQVDKGEMLGGSARVFGSCWNMQQIENNRRSFDWELNWKKLQQESNFTEHKAVSAAYKPVGEPKCSQCGKPFKPEKMHSHMKSCRGIKALAKTTFAERTPVTPS